MTIGDVNPIDPRLELERIRERLRYTEERVQELKESIKQKDALLERKNNEFQRINSEREDLRVQLGEAKKEIENLRDRLRLALESKKASGRGSKSLSVLGNLLIFFAGVLAAFGANLLTEATPNSLGWLLLVVALLSAIGGTFVLATKGEE